MPAAPAFIFGLMLGSILTLALQAMRRRSKAREARLAQAGAAEIGALKQRLAALEQIATDPATRTARAIDALREPA